MEEIKKVRGGYGQLSVFMIDIELQLHTLF
jgi:hypothetical protein